MNRSHFIYLYPQLITQHTTRQQMVTLTIKNGDNGDETDFDVSSDNTIEEVVLEAFKDLNLGKNTNESPSEYGLYRNGKLLAPGKSVAKLKLDSNTDGLVLKKKPNQGISISNSIGSVVTIGSNNSVTNTSRGYDKVKELERLTVLLADANQQHSFESLQKAFPQQ